MTYRSDRNTLRASPPPPPPPPLTVQTRGPKWLFFWREILHVNTFRGTEAIFSRDEATLYEGCLCPSVGPSDGPQPVIFSAY